MMERRTANRGTLYRLGVYDPLSDEQPVEWVEGVFRNTRYDRILMASAVREYNRLAAATPGAFGCLGIFAVAPESLGSVSGGDADVVSQSG